MIRLWTFLFLCSCVLVCVTVQADSDEALDKLFSNSDDETKSQCGGIDGELSQDCYECYKCEDKRLRNYATRPKHLDLTDKSCKTTTVCCVPQEDLIPRDSGQCGVLGSAFKVVKGIKQEKTNVRSVLKGEYPWRAWIYRIKDNRLLCAGTIVEDTGNFLLTSATCVYDYLENELIVSFSRDLDEEINVEAIQFHESYRSHKPGINDIALLKLNKARDLTPRWVKPVCYTVLPPMHATTCTVISDTDYFINQVIPLPKKCKTWYKELHVSQICAVAPPGDYVPETGAGLFCPDRFRTGDSNFFIFGIALKQHESMTIYTNVSYFAEWIEQKISIL